MLCIGRSTRRVRGPVKQIVAIAKEGGNACLSGNVSCNRDSCATAVQRDAGQQSDITVVNLVTRCRYIRPQMGHVSGGQGDATICAAQRDFSIQMNVIIRNQGEIAIAG